MNQRFQQGYEIEISSERAFMIDLRALNMLSRVYLPVGIIESK